VWFRLPLTRDGIGGWVDEIIVCLDLVGFERAWMARMRWDGMLGCVHEAR